MTKEYVCQCTRPHIQIKRIIKPIGICPTCKHTITEVELAEVENVPVKG